MKSDQTIQDLERLHRESFAWCLVCCRGHRDEAEEVLQTTYLKVLDGRARHEGLGDLKPWLFAVIRRTAAGRRRRAALWRLRLLPSSEAQEGASGASTPEREAIRNDEAGKIREALSVLSQRQRQALELVFYHGLSLRQAAPVMGVTLGAIRSHYHRGKQRLQGMLEKGRGPCPMTTSRS